VSFGEAILQERKLKCEKAQDVEHQMLQE